MAGYREGEEGGGGVFLMVGHVPVYGGIYREGTGIWKGAGSDHSIQGV